MPVEPAKDNKYPEGNVTAGPYVDDELGGELTMDELKAAFRIFDDAGEGFITVYRFREILKEIDEEITEEELEGIIGDIDLDHSNTIDFDEFVKVMT